VRTGRKRKKCGIFTVLSRKRGLKGIMGLFEQEITRNNGK